MTNPATPPAADMTAALTALGLTAAAYDALAAADQERVRVLAASLAASKVAARGRGRNVHANRRA